MQIEKFFYFLFGIRRFVVYNIIGIEKFSLLLLLRGLIMQATLNKEETEVTLTVPFNKKGVPSKKRNKDKEVVEGEGKSLLHFSENGRTLIGGREVKFGVNGYSPNPNYKDN